MDEVRPDLLAATLDRCLTVPAAMGILAGTRSGKRSFCDGMDPADSSLVTCGHSQPRLCLLRQSVAW
jgi:hypothetical protein